MIDIDTAELHQWTPDRESRWLDVAERFARFSHADEDET